MPGNPSHIKAVANWNLKNNGRRPLYNGRATPKPSMNPTHSDNRSAFSIGRWLLVFFVVFVLTVLSGAYITLQVLPKIYTATAEIQIRPRAQMSVQSSTDAGDQPFDPPGVESDLIILRSSDVLLPVVQNLNLDKIWAKRIYKSKQDHLPAQESLAYMNKILRIDCVRGTNIVKITAASEVPQEAADIANGVANQYKKMRDEAKAWREGLGLGSLRNQIAQQQEVVEEKKAALENLRPDAAHLDPSQSLLKIELEQRKKDLLTAKEDYDARQVLLKSFNDRPDDQVVNTVGGLNKSLPDIEGLRADALRMENDLKSLKADGFPDNHPRVEALQVELDRKRKQIVDLIAGYRRATQVDTAMAKKRVALLQKEVDDLAAKSSKDTPETQASREAQEELEQEQSVLNALTIRLKQNEANRSFDESPVRIIALAQTPIYPSSPNKVLNLAIMLLTGIILGGTVATLVEVAFGLARNFSPRVSL